MEKINVYSFSKLKTDPKLVDKLKRCTLLRNGAMYDLLSCLKSRYACCAPNIKAITLTRDNRILGTALLVRYGKGDIQFQVHVYKRYRKQGVATRLWLRARKIRGTKRLIFNTAHDDAGFGLHRKIKRLARKKV